MSDPRILVALDYPAAADADRLVERLDPSLCRLKVGKELFTAAGPRYVEQLAARGFEVFLDLKFHDIPNTVASACRVAADLGVWMLNVHALGGRRMLEAAREAVGEGAERPRLIAVTVLTSMEQADLGELGITEPVGELVDRLAGLAGRAGLDGVVCSAREAGPLARHFGGGGLMVTPGIRPAGAARGDQRRVMTPAEARAAGSTHIVVGRPVTRAEDPAAAVEAIAAEWERAG